MLKTAVRVSGIGLAVCGLAVAFAPAAGASPINKPARPVIQSVSGPTSFEVYSPCTGDLITSSGKATSVTVTTGQHTDAGYTDVESGDGYTLVTIGAGSFNALSSSYTFTAEGVWVDPSDLRESFRATITTTMYVTSGNAPDGLSSVVDSASCGL